MRINCVAYILSLFFQLSSAVGGFREDNNSQTTTTREIRKQKKKENSALGNTRMEWAEKNILMSSCCDS